MLVRLCALLRVMAFEMALITNRGHALHGLTGIQTQFLRNVETFALRFRQTSEYREHRGEVQDVRIEVHISERWRTGYQLLVDAGFVLVRQRIRHLDDDHAVEQGLVLLLLKELVELGQVRVRENGFVEVNEREAGHLDILLLRHRQQEIEELTLHLQDLDHLEHAAARGIHGAGP
jgi:hypothetical protein